MYSWYDSEDSTTPIASSSDPEWRVTNVQANTVYFVSASACQKKTPVPIIIRRIQLTANGQVPTGPIRLVPGGTVTLQATCSLPGPLTWFFNGLQISSPATASTSSFVATQLGRYTVQTQFPTIEPDKESQAVELIGELDNQVANGQIITYVSDTQVLQAGVSTTEQVRQLPVASRSQNITYLTGWGQPLQQVAAQTGPAQEDIVQHYAHVGSPTTSLTYLPVPVSSTIKPAGAYETNPIARLNAYYGVGEAAAAAVVESSPLGRPVSQTPAGSAWATHPNKVSYATNTALDGVRVWSVAAGSKPNSSNIYAAGQLSKEIFVDADGRRTEVYKDGLGRAILQRKITGFGTPGQQNFDTYSIFADAGYLQYVIPPEAINTMAAANNWSIASMPTGFAAQWLYQYTYDDRGRLVERQFPGAAPVYLVYDKFDRLILVQDGNHRAASQWLFTKFDAANRTVVSGLYKYDSQAATVRQDLQNLADSTIITADFENRNDGGFTTNKTYPDVIEGTNGTVLSITVFDDYDLNQNGTADYDYTAQGFGTLPEPSATMRLQGSTTIRKVRIVQPNGQYGNWLLSVLFYDQYGNLIQKKSNNLLQTGTVLNDITTLVYKEKGFIPQILASLKTQQTPALTGNFSPVVSVRNRYAYDPAGRRLQTWQQHQWKDQWEPEVLVSSNTYTGLGELTLKKLHSRDGVNYLQIVNFTYNLHGQLRSINNSDKLLADNPDNDLFALNIIREQIGDMGSTPRYDGGISAVTWATHNAAQTNQPERQRSYRFVYDGLGRMKDALYMGLATLVASGDAEQMPSPIWNAEAGAYDERNITYDANGNIKTLQRYTKVNDSFNRTLLDNLTYTYTGTGNQHNKINDTGNITRGFKDARTAQEYAYDSNGSITRDDNKGVSYTYNVLNKVAKQTVGTGTLQYTYDAAGTLLKRETVLNGITSKTEYYIDGAVYQASSGTAGLLSLPIAEGRAVVGTPTDTRLAYEYHLRDHLGNLRVAFRAQAGTDDLRLSSEDPDQEEGDYPRFHNVADTQSRATGIGAFEGEFEAAVVAGKEGPSIAIPVSHADHIKVRVYYHTPNGIQTYYSAPAGRLAQTGNAMALALAPTVLATPGNENRPGRSVPGVQLSITGLLSRLGKRAKAPHRPLARASGIQLNAYLRWTLTDAKGSTLGTGTVLAEDTPDSEISWAPLDLSIDIDLSSAAARTGQLRIEEVNDGDRPVYFDSLTITHPRDQALVTQEQHYYPFGMALSGVAVNTIPPVPNVSKDQFNEGSALQDELLGAEGGVYSTFYRTYDPVTGRFTGVDPLADKFANQTPYHFGNNNPIDFNDPTGAISTQGGVANDCPNCPKGGKAGDTFDDSGNGNPFFFNGTDWVPLLPEAVVTGWFGTYGTPGGVGTMFFMRNQGALYANNFGYNTEVDGVTYGRIDIKTLGGQYKWNNTRNTISGSAQAVGQRINYSAKFGNKYVNNTASGRASLFLAEVKAAGGIYSGQNGKHGFNAEASGGAYVFKAEGQEQVEICGFILTVSLTGAVGYGASGSVINLYDSKNDTYTSGIKGSFAAALGAGGGISITIPGLKSFTQNENYRW